MTRKERVKAVLDKKPIDKIPFGEFAIDFDTVEKILGHETYLRAKAKSQIAYWEGRRDEVVDSLKRDTVEFYKKIGCFDIINLAAMIAGVCPPKGYICEEPPKKIDDTTWKDKQGRIYKYSDITADITIIEDPTVWEKEYTIDDFQVNTMEKPDDSIFEVVDYVIDALGDEYFIIGPSGPEAGMVLLGDMERGLSEYILNPSIVKQATYKALKEANQMDFYYINKKADAIMWGQDFAFNTGSFISPALFKEICLPSIKERVAHVKNNFNKYVFKHACGNNWELMDFFIEAHYDCYQSVQGSASMELGKVLQNYRDEMCIWGGLPVEHLVSGTKEDIKKDIKYIKETAFAGGNYIFGSSHSIAVGTKYDNFMTMIDEFEKVRNCV